MMLNKKNKEYLANLSILSLYYLEVCITRAMNLAK